MRSVLFACFLLFCTSPAAAQSSTPAEAKIFTYADCGLDYAQGNVLLGKKMAFYGMNYYGADQPAPIIISGIPPAAVIKKAFLWWDHTGPGVTASVTLQNPDTAIRSFSGVLVGSGTPKCWGYGAAAFRADVTAHVTGNGTYYVSGLPTDTTFTADDVNGISLFIVYSDPSAGFWGSLTMEDGFDHVRFDTVTFPLSVSVRAASTSARAFMMLSDFQDESASAISFNGSSYLGFQEDFWDFEEKATAVTAAQTVVAFGIRVPNDCVNLIVKGLYYRLPVALDTPVVTQNVNTLTSTAAPFYQWYRNDTLLAGATGQSYVAGLDGIYFVEVSDSNGCKRRSDTLYVVVDGVADVSGAGRPALFPNPSSGLIRVAGEGATETTCRVYDLAGRLVAQGRGAGVFDIDLTAQGSGLYTVVLDVGGKVTYHRIAKY